MMSAQTLSGERRKKRGNGRLPGTEREVGRRATDFSVHALIEAFSFFFTLFTYHMSKENHLNRGAGQIQKEKEQVSDFSGFLAGFSEQSATCVSKPGYWGLGRGGSHLRDCCNCRTSAPPRPAETESAFLTRSPGESPAHTCKCERHWV